jgi:hypothetical protein
MELTRKILTLIRFCFGFWEKHLSPLHHNLITNVAKVGKIRLTKLIEVVYQQLQKFGSKLSFNSDKFGIFEATTMTWLDFFSCRFSFQIKANSTYPLRLTKPS